MCLTWFTSSRTGKLCIYVGGMYIALLRTYLEKIIQVITAIGRKHLLECLKSNYPVE